ncbi:MAG: hypothetical protein AB7O78_16105 [Thermoleophilia bacterium]
MRRMTPLGAVGRGLVAGALGTGAMTAAQLLRSRLHEQAQDGGEGADDGSAQAPGDPWEEAPAPAKVARRVLEGVFGRQVPAERIGLLTNAMHWGYGTAWGAVYGLLRGSGVVHGARGGLAFGAAVWGMSYVELVPMGLYEPPWEYPPGQLAPEAGYHLAYGLGTAAGFSMLSR